jgi:hypothetical protein
MGKIAMHFLDLVAKTPTNYAINVILITHKSLFYYKKNSP